MTHPDWWERADRLSLRVRNLVEGRWVESSSGTIDKLGPRDGRLLYQLPQSDGAAADHAVAVARAAFEDGRWSHLPVARQREMLFKLAALLDQHREELALLECLDVGKPIQDALNFDIPACSALIRYCAEAIDKLHGKLYWSDRTSYAYELRRPAGVVAGIVGWNFPLLLAAQKAGPALATGNSLVLKPSEYTSLSASRLAELALEAGVPPGIFNVVHGDRELGSLLAHHRDVDLLSFTGSTATGRAVLVAAGQSNMKRLILECGGKAPNIVFEDCSDLAAVAEAIVASAYWNQGEVCVASSRLLVQESIRAPLLQAIAARIADMRAGDPLDPATRYGALVNRIHLRKVISYLEEARGEGDRLVCQGTLSSAVEGGFYLAPQVFELASSRTRLAQEEIFGPVLGILSFHDEREAIRVANDTIYGLSAIVWTRDAARAHRLTYGIRAGSITVNGTSRPQGGMGDHVLSVGGHKQSGIGVEGGLAGLEAYTTQTAVQHFL